jgi:hypothetical protein
MVHASGKGEQTPLLQGAAGGHSSEPVHVAGMVRHVPRPRTTFGDPCVVLAQMVSAIEHHSSAPLHACVDEHGAPAPASPAATLEPQAATSGVEAMPMARRASFCMGPP